MIIDKISSIDFSSTDVSPGTLIAISLAGIAVAVILFLFLKVCINCERRTGRPSFSWLKIILIGIGPALLSSKAFFNVGVDLKIAILITAVAVAIALIWNILTYGLICGIMFTVLQALGGLLGGISVVAIVVVAVLALIVASSGGIGGSESSDDPEEIYEVGSNQLYRLEGSKGSRYIYVNGTVIPVRRDDYGNWIDGNGHLFKNAH